MRSPSPRWTWLLLPALQVACASVPAGHAAVVTDPFGGVRPAALPEGASWIGPLGEVDLLDLRAQERDEDLSGIAADGAPVQANASVVTYHVVPAEVVAFDREVGPDAYRQVVRPVVQAAVRAVVARYPALALIDSRNRPAIQDAITAMGARQLRPMHLVLDQVFLRTVTVTSGPLDAEILETSRQEQLVQQMAHELELARGRAEVRREQARALAREHAIVAPTLTPQGLADRERDAWAALLAAPTSSVAVAAGVPASVEIPP